MKKRIRNLSLIVAFALLAAFIPLLRGSGLTYQWYYKKVGQSGFSIWKGHTSASDTCTPNAIWNGIQLYCIIKDSAGNTVKSDTITVTIK